MKRQVTCSFCGKPGHYRPRCPDLPHDEKPPRTTGSRSELAARHLHEHGGTTFEVAALFGVTHQAVSQTWRRLYGKEPTPGTLDEGWRRFQVIALAMDGVPSAEIGRIAGVTGGGVFQICERAGVHCNGAMEQHMEAVDRAVAAVAAGACIVDAAIDNDMAYQTLARHLRERRVKAKRGGMGDRRDGRARRALALMDAGMAQADAARAERVSTISVRAARMRRAAGGDERERAAPDPVTAGSHAADRR